MTIKGQAYIVGAYEHPTRKAPDKSVAQLHAESAVGALADAGLTKDDVDGYFCAGDAPGMGPLAMADYMNLRLRHLDSTDLGGCSYIAHVAHAAEAIAAGKCSVALITLAGRPRSEGHSGANARPAVANAPDAPWEAPFGPVTANIYAISALSRRTSTPCAPCATCTSSARPPSNWPGSRSRPATMPNTTRTPC
ncbi:MAG: hypothetical protein WDN49_01595 [Acetobacteraceae bacterium]